jgi:hypothetical protein
MNRYTIWIPGVVVAAAVTLTAPAADEPAPKDNIDATLLKVAPAVVKELAARGYKNVGVLKFRVADSDGVLRGNVGPLNRTLADRLEVALTLNLPDDDKKADKDKLGIVAGASDVVAKSGYSANYLTEKGRKELFEIGTDTDLPLFRVPWKKRGAKILPDAFLTGEVRMSKDRMTADVTILLFDKKDPAKNPEEIKAAHFTAQSDARTLTDLGLSYTSRGGFDPKSAVVLADKAAPTPDDKGDALQKKADEALELFKKSPVKLKVLYNGKPQEVRTDVGEAYSGNVLLRVAPMEQGQKVTFELTNTSDDKYGVVLRINGRNTIFEQRQDPAACYKWILDPHKKIEVVGWQRTTAKADEFEVLSPSQSELEAVNYGDNAGTIDLILFKGEKKPEEALVLNDADRERATIGRGAMVLKTEPSATDLRSFKSQLREEGKQVTLDGKKGGLLGSGGSVKNPVEEQKFYSGPIPSFSTTIRYYSVKK